MFIELHILQNFAPSCLNRDDTNSPKDCVFGGVRRARISSQCIKRAIREHTTKNSELASKMGIRTKRVPDLVVKQLIEQGKSEEEAMGVVEHLLSLMELKVTEKNGEHLTQYVLFIGKEGLERLAQTAIEHWEFLVEATGKKKTAKKTEKNDKKNMPKEIKAVLDAVMDSRGSVDIAMFGRMLADLPKNNTDAACQVAHALSTHKVEMEMDFFTAVDDLKPEENSGADMMGTVEFNSACFYRYAVIHWEKLVENLGNDMELAVNAIEAFLHASVKAIPTGKQNTFAAHNPPSLVFGVVRSKGNPWSLANAFEKPITAHGEGLIQKSMGSLNEYWGNLTTMFDTQPDCTAWVALDKNTALDQLGPRSANVNEFIDTLLSKIKGETS